MNAIIIKSARCKGKGRDPYKRINGISKEILLKVAEIDENAVLLVPSNTKWQNQQYKIAVFVGAYGWTHRQCKDSDYNIIAEI